MSGYSDEELDEMEQATRDDLEYKPLWIAVDGVDGAGKGVVIDILQELLDTKTDVIPAIGNTPSTANIPLRNACKNNTLTDTIKPIAICMLIVESYNKACLSLIQGRNVLHDRYIGSFYAYNYLDSDQKNTNELYTSILNSKTMMPNSPDLHIYVTADNDVISNRMICRDDCGALDKKVLANLDEYKRRYAQYYAYEVNEPVHIVENNGSIGQLTNKLIKILGEHL